MATEILREMKGCTTELSIVGVSFSMMKSEWNAFCTELANSFQRCNVTLIILDFWSPKSVGKHDPDRINRFERLLLTLRPNVRRARIYVVASTVFSSYFLIGTKLHRFFHAFGQPTSPNTMFSTSDKEHLESVRQEINALIGDPGTWRLKDEGAIDKELKALQALRLSQEDIGERRAQSKEILIEFPRSEVKPTFDLFGSPDILGAPRGYLTNLSQSAFVYVTGLIAFEPDVEPWIFEQLTLNRTFVFFFPDPWQPFFYSSYHNPEQIGQKIKNFLEKLISNPQVTLCLVDEPISNHEIIGSDSSFSFRSHYPGYSCDRRSPGFIRIDPREVQKRVQVLESYRKEYKIARKEHATILSKVPPPFCLTPQKSVQEYAEQVFGHCRENNKSGVVGSSVFVSRSWHDKRASVLLAVDHEEFELTHRYVTETFPDVVIQLVGSKFEDRVLESGQDIATGEIVLENGQQVVKRWHATLGYMMQNGQGNYAVTAAHLLQPHDPKVTISSETGVVLGRVSPEHHHYSVPPVAGTPPPNPTKDHMFISLAFVDPQNPVPLAENKEIVLPGHFFTSFIIFTRDGTFEIPDAGVQYAFAPANLDRHYRHILNVHCSTKPVNPRAQDCTFADPGQSGSVMVGITRFPDGTEERAILGILKFEYMANRTTRLNPRAAGFIPIDTIDKSLLHQGNQGFLTI